MKSRGWNCLSSAGGKIFLHFLLQGQPEYQARCLIRCTVGSGRRIERVFQITEIKKKPYRNSWNSLFKKQCRSPGPEMPGRMCNGDRWHTRGLRFSIKYTTVKYIHSWSLVNNHFFKLALVTVSCFLSKSTHSEDVLSWIFQSLVFVSFRGFWAQDVVRSLLSRAAPLSTRLW